MQEGKKWEHLKGIAFPQPVQPNKVDLLIGLDCADIHCSLRDVTGEAGSPIARLTPFGWTCVGPITAHPQTADYGNYTGPDVETEPHEQSVDKQLRLFWEIENVKEDQPMSPDEQVILKATQESMVFNGERYQVSLPWKHGRPTTLNNFATAVQRLQHTMKRLAKSPELAERYATNIAEYVQKGYVRQVPSDEQLPSSVWFLPHFPVVQLDKATTKVRIVFDGSARHAGTSLNDLLHPGPKLQRELSDVLLDFGCF